MEPQRKSPQLIVSDWTPIRIEGERGEVASVRNGEVFGTALVMQSELGRNTPEQVAEVKRLRLETATRQVLLHIAQTPNEPD